MFTKFDGFILDSIYFWQIFVICIGIRFGVRLFLLKVDVPS